MNFSSVAVFVSLILTITNSMLAEGLCRHLKFSSPVHGAQLKGHVIKTMSIGIYASCKHLCTMESRCLSFNLGPPVKGKMACELSDSDVTKHSRDLIKRKGFVYRDTEDACSSNPCPHNTTCLNGFTDKGYTCQCQAGYKGEQCKQENWEKVNDQPVCFEGKGNKYGKFHIKESGLVYTFKLVHKSDSIACNPHFPASYWGCTNPNTYAQEKLITVITYPNKTALLIADYLRDDSDCGPRYYSYQIAGIGVNSPELVFNNLPVPLSVSVGQEFQIWYGQDLKDCFQDDNTGKTCADVYAWYA